MDGDVTNMVEGFPEVETQASHVEVIARFPRFTTSGSYRFLLKPDRRNPAILKEKMSARQYRTEFTKGYTTVKTLVETVHKNENKLSHSPKQQKLETSHEVIDPSSSSVRCSALTWVFGACFLTYILKM